MSAGSRLLSALARLPGAATRAIVVEHNLPVRMPDGVTLLADRYAARGQPGGPIVLIRTPYGRGRLTALVARLFAERGYQVVLQSCRGTFGSGGDFNAFRDEQVDGLATLEWLAAQPWFTGSVGMFGPSYLGIVQWAVAGDAPPFLHALAPSLSTARLRQHIYPGGAFALDSTLTWLHTLSHQEASTAHTLGSELRERHHTAAARDHLPLRDADTLISGRPVRYYQDWLAHDGGDDPFWDPVAFDYQLGAVTAPVSMVAGWYDMFLPFQLADYRALRAAGRDVRITIGPWKHVAAAGAAVFLRDAVDHFDRHLKPAAGTRRRAAGAAPRPRVRIFVTGTRRWYGLDEWPPPTAPQRWHLHPGRRLEVGPPAAAEPDRYRYDPADPTPSVGGTVLGRHAGPRDNRRLETRADVLVYTSQRLVSDLTVIGPVTAELYARSSLPNADFFARLCDVQRSGHSINICDGLIRLSPDDWELDGDGAARVGVELWPAAHCFRAGHRIRLQVSSGAHPRFARNLGSGEPLGTGTRLAAADQQIFHDPRHPSALLLPVFGRLSPQS